MESFPLGKLTDLAPSRPPGGGDRGGDRGATVREEQQRGAVSLRQIGAALARRGVKTARGEDWKRCAGPERADPDELMSLNPSLV